MTESLEDNHQKTVSTSSVVPEVGDGRKWKVGEVGPPRVAVLMAVIDTDREDYLRQAIDSILGQTYPHNDIHIRISGTLSESKAVLLNDYAAKHESVYLHFNSEKKPLAVNMNDLIQQLWYRYNYFARMDSDDESVPDRIKRQIAYLEAHPEVDVVGGSIIDIGENGRELKRASYPVEHSQILGFFRKRNPMAHVTVMYRRSYFEKAGLYPSVALEDGLYWMQGFLAGCRFHNLPEYLVRVRRTDAFLKRRSGLRKQWEELKIKWHINWKLRFGLASYIYALAVFVIQLMPVGIKAILYNRLR
jgi:glycosyltransferase involved in cell wall biosynthesis